MGRGAHLLTLPNQQIFRQGTVIRGFNWGEQANITLLIFLVHHLNIKSCYREACGGLKEDDRTLFQMTANEKLNKTDCH